MSKKQKENHRDNIKIKLIKTKKLIEDVFIFLGPLVLFLIISGALNFIGIKTCIPVLFLISLVILIIDGFILHGINRFIRLDHVTYKTKECPICGERIIEKRGIKFSEHQKKWYIYSIILKHKCIMKKILQTKWNPSWNCKKEDKWNHSEGCPKCGKEIIEKKFLYGSGDYFYQDANYTYSCLCASGHVFKSIEREDCDPAYSFD